MKILFNISIRERVKCHHCTRLQVLQLMFSVATFFSNVIFILDIVVKIVTKKLGDRYYKKKGIVVEVRDKYTAVVKLLDKDEKLKMDQTHLESVLPALGVKTNATQLSLPLESVFLQSWKAGTTQSCGIFILQHVFCHFLSNAGPNWATIPAAKVSAGQIIYCNILWGALH